MEAQQQGEKAAESNGIVWKNDKLVATFFSRIGKVLFLLLQPCAYQKLYKCLPAEEGFCDLRLLDAMGWEHGPIASSMKPCDMFAQRGLFRSVRTGKNAGTGPTRAPNGRTYLFSELFSCVLAHNACNSSAYADGLYNQNVKARK